MKRLSSLFLIATVLFTSAFIAASGPVYSTTYTYVTPKSRYGRRCANQCINQKSMCQNNCNMLTQACHMQANAIAQPAYQAYLNQTEKQGKTPYRSIKAFADYSSCRDNCGCKTNYNQCFTGCGGQIIPHTVCTMFCDKAKA